MKQRTLLREQSIEGKGIHTGNTVHLTLKPAPEDTGIVFRRVDLYGKPEIRPSAEQVSDVVRSTTVGTGHVKIHTVEHVLSALSGCGIDNAIVEMDASEPPILDGSALPYVHLILKAEPIEQTKERLFWEVKEPISVTNGNRSLIALPYDGFKITCTSADDRGFHTQHLSLDIDTETYVAQLAAARTFAFYEEIEPLLKLGKIQGGSLDAAIVIKGNSILSRESLRFADEFVRHKILDIVGDLALLGRPLKAHIIAVRTGHALNTELAKKIYAHVTQKNDKATGKSAPLKVVSENDTHLDIRKILNALPHRYPFVMIDRVIDIPDADTLRAVKNVTINEPFFQGHFPGNPVMPGVLQLEAMAQAAGILMFRRLGEGVGSGKVAFFMSCDKVKFRKPVVPGDQLEICVKLTKTRGTKLAVAEGVCKVNDQEVSSAELMFSVVDV